MARGAGLDGVGVTASEPCVLGDLPAPLVPAEVDLRDFAFMPLDVQRLRDSDLASDETPEACWAAVLLWCASWHQVPAASIPDSDQWQAKQAGYVAQGRIAPAWKKVKAGALRGWVRCGDGRLYHPVVAEKALEAWRSKLQQRWRTECARIKKHNQRHETSLPLPEFDAWVASGCPQGQMLPVPGDKTPSSPGLPGEIASKGQGQGQGQGQGLGGIPSEADASAAGAAPLPDGGQPQPPAPPAPPSPPPPPAKSPEEMAKAELWRAAVSVLEQGGCPPSQCRTFMGKLVGDYTFPVVQKAVAQAVTAQPADAREYLKATCQRLKGERADAPTVPSDAADKTQDYLRSQLRTPEQRAASLEAARVLLAKRSGKAVTA